MNMKPKWTAADRSRHQAIRAQFEDGPSLEDIQGGDDHEPPIKAGAYFAVRRLVRELRKIREAAGMTLAEVSAKTGMDQATLSRLETGRQPNPTIDTLWRYARAIGRRVVLTHSDMEPRSNDRANGTKARAKKARARK